MFLENYFPESARDARQMQFLELRQGDMTVPEYEARFTTLARFAPDLVMTEANRCKRFERGIAGGDLRQDPCPQDPGVCDVGRHGSGC